LFVFAIFERSIWIGIMTLFLVSQAFVGWRQAQYLRLEETHVTAATGRLAKEKDLL
jgi:hypothetical protein